MQSQLYLERQLFYKHRYLFQIIVSLSHGYKYYIVLYTPDNNSINAYKYVAMPKVHSGQLPGTDFEVK